MKKRLPDLILALLALTLVLKGLPGLLDGAIWVSPKHSRAFLLTGSAARWLGGGFAWMGVALALATASRWGMQQKVAFTLAGAAGALAVVSFGMSMAR